MDTDTKPDQQPELNPGERHANEQFKVSNEQSPPGNSSGNEESAAEQAKEREAQAATGANSTQDAAKSERSGAGGLADKAKNAAIDRTLASTGLAGRALAAMRKNKKGTAIGGGMTFLIMMAVFAFVTVAPAGIFLHLKEIGTRWMTKYQEIGMGRRATKLLKQSYFGDSSQCTGTQWKCRNNQGISDKELKKLERAGFEVETQERGNPKKKYVVTMAFDDPITRERKSVGAGNFVSAFKNDAGFRSVFGKVMSPKAYNLRSKAVISKLVGKFGVNRRGFSGDDTDRESLVKKLRKHLYTRSNVDASKVNIDESKYNGEGKPTLDVSKLEGIGAELGKEADALNKEALENGVPPSALPSAAGLLNGSEDTLTKIGQTLGEGIKGGAKGAVFGALAGVDAYCSIYQIIRTLSFMLKVYAAAQLLQYASVFLTGADELKSGHLTTAAAALIAGILLKPSSKPESKGKTVSDSALVTLISEGKVNDQESLQRFTIGGGLRQTLDRVLKYLNIGKVSPTVCGKLNTPLGQIGLAIGGILSSILTGGFTGVAFGAAVGAAKGIAMGIVGQFAMPYIIEMLAGVVAPDPDKDPEGGLGAGNAILAGLTAFGSEVGKSSAFQPLTKAQVAALDESTREERRTIAKVNELESKEKGLFSWDNPMSFNNKMALALSPLLSTITQNPSISAIASQSAAMVGTGFGTLPQLVGGSAYAQEKVDYYRGDLCADAANEAYNLATTAVCGEVYGPDPRVLGEDETYDQTPVDKYMLDNNYVTNEETGTVSDEVKEFKEICMDSTDVPITEDGKGIEASEDGFGVCLDKNVKYTYFRQFLGYENDRQSREDAANDKLGIGASEAAGGGGADGGTITGDAKSLAQQILTNKNVEFNTVPEEGATARKSFEAIAAGELAEVDFKGTKTTISSALMRAILETAKTYSFRIGYTTNGNHGASSRHYSGRAMDVNAINGQGPLIVNGQHKQISRDFSEHIAKFLPQGGGIGENTCMGPLDLPPGINYFYDECNHLHIDVGDTAQ